MRFGYLRPVGHRLTRLGLFFAVLSGCSATIPEGVYACDPEPCPSGFACVDGFCFRGTPDDAGIDARREDTAVDSTVDVPFDGDGVDAPRPDAPVPDGALPDGGPCGPCDGGVCVDGECCQQIQQVSGRAFTICALTRDGDLFCWGDNAQTQIGPGPETIAAPVAIDSPSGSWSFVDTGGSPVIGHTCAIGVDTGLYCWGDHSRGQLGVGGPAVGGRDTPTEVGGTGWTDVSVANLFTCGIRGGQLYCWGAPSSGALGVSPRPGGPVPAPGAPVTTDTSWTDVDCNGAGCCAIRSAGLECWGDNIFGQVGVNRSGDEVDVPSPVATDVSDTSCGERHCCAVRSGGFCWGDARALQLGTEDQDAPIDPVALAEATMITAIEAGKTHSCAVGGLDTWCWGNNDNGKLGIGSTVEQAVGQRVGLAATQLTAGYQHTCGIDPEGRLWCWGLDPGTSRIETAPVPVCIPFD